MGQAKQRGDFEQRKKQAIDSGRVKSKAIKHYSSTLFYPGFPGGIFDTSTMFLAGSVAGKYWPRR